MPASNEQVIADLTRVKAEFQLRAIATALGLDRTTPLIPAIDCEDGAERFVRLSADNPARPNTVDDAGRDGAKCHRSVAPVSFHAGAGRP